MTYRIPALQRGEAPGRCRTFTSDIAIAVDDISKRACTLRVQPRVQEAKGRLPRRCQAVVEQRDDARGHWGRCASAEDAREARGVDDIVVCLGRYVGVRASTAVVHARVRAAVLGEEALDSGVLVCRAGEVVREGATRALPCLLWFEQLGPANGCDAV